MTVKELIKQLQELEKKHGDLEVMLDTEIMLDEAQFWEILSVKQNFCTIYEKDYEGEYDKPIISIGVVHDEENIQQ